MRQKTRGGTHFLQIPLSKARTASVNDASGSVARALLFITDCHYECLDRGTPLHKSLTCNGLRLVNAAGWDHPLKRNTIPHRFRLSDKRSNFSLKRPLTTFTRESGETWNCKRQVDWQLDRLISPIPCTLFRQSRRDRASPHCVHWYQAVFALSPIIREISYSFILSRCVKI